MRYTVSFIQTNEREIEVEAEDRDDAENKALDILEENTFQENIDMSQQGYFETGDIEEVKENDQS